MANSDLKNNIYSFISWKHVRIYSQQMCNSLFVDIICIGLYMLVSVTNSATIYMCNCGVKHVMRLQKWSDICIKWYLSHKQRSAVWFD